MEGAQPGADINASESVAAQKVDVLVRDRLILNAIVLWNSCYLDAGEQLRTHPPKDREVLDEDVARLSPLGYKHINTLGRYNFIASQPGESLRPLRDPSQHEEDEG
ncbi:hypothetical protein GCM10009677_52390 [Sphaerisporangium rubeum]|uniref:Tn3 transposase DDE domain-containing protein n=1 Tax=Sphaerisporangium rubeum TaxID=321317 RepID=A0A7X0IF59_9ACTN|nr:Tn3 family transposase [Sphaerisporangium rubeum]MBB6473905.1 hypothetical protein [Sphaerisporangium rubeum]